MRSMPPMPPAPSGVRTATRSGLDFSRGLVLSLPMLQNHRCCARLRISVTSYPSKNESISSSAAGEKILHYRVEKYKMEIFRQLNIVHIGTDPLLCDLS